MIYDIDIKNIVKPMKRIIFAIILLATAVSCKKEDDIDEIFVGHNWKLSFIQEGSLKKGADKGYGIIFQEKTFNATLPGGNSINGYWEANGDTRQFHCTDVRANGNLEGDETAEKILRILTNAKEYDGTTTWLQIKEKKNSYIQFHNR